jgi:hypothetical protein
MFCLSLTPWFITNCKLKFLVMISEHIWHAATSLGIFGLVVVEIDIILKLQYYKTLYSSITQKFSPK